MTTLQLSQDALNVIATEGAALGIRYPVVTTPYDGTPRTCEWTPDLSAAEQAILAFIQGATNAAVDITPAERQLLEPFLATGRAWVQGDRNTYVGLSEAESRRQTFDSMTALWRVFFRLLRDG